MKESMSSWQMVKTSQIDISECLKRLNLEQDLNMITKNHKILNVMNIIS